jgi:hypothetical protein
VTKDGGILNNHFSIARRIRGREEKYFFEEYPCKKK